MALRTSVLAASFAGAAAFVPPTTQRTSNNLRAVDTQANTQAALEVAPEQGMGTKTVAAIGLAVAGLAVTAKAGRPAKRAGKIVRNITGGGWGGGAASMPGICAPLTEKWDPLNLSNTPAKFERYTAVEIKHGRISMIACVGYIFADLFRFPGCENFKNGLAALGDIPLEGWVQLAALIGAHEALVKPREGGYGSYDFGLGVELLEGQPAEEIERRQTVERNNGRLAMVGILGMMWQDGQFGLPPVQYLYKNGWWAGPAEKFTSYMPACVPSDTVGMAMCAFGGGRKVQHGPRGLCTARKQKTARQVVIYEDPFPESPIRSTEPTKMSMACPWLPHPTQLDGYAGGETGFDPLGFTDVFGWPVYYMREAELKHGRVAMLATLGWIATDCGVRFPGAVFQNTDTINAHNDLIKANIMFPAFMAIFTLELYSIYLLSLAGVDGQGQAGSEFRREAGDIYLGKNFLPTDPEKKKDMQLRVLKNGRLAMLAFSGIATVSVALGKKWPFF